jgi:hypothetical protein
MLMPLVGQTQIAQPQEVLPMVVARIQQEPDAERRQQLVTGLLALLAAEEWVRRVLVGYWRKSGHDLAHLGC